MKKNFDVIALGELLIDFTENALSEQGNPLMEANPGHILLLDDYRCTCLAENHCIVVLMISCNYRRRDEYRTSSCCFKLCKS